MTPSSAVDGPQAWIRLVIACGLSSLAAVGMWAPAVFLPIIQAEFGIDRGSASIAYTATTIGFGIGGLIMGRLSDRFGILVPVLLGAVMLSAGFGLSALAQSYWQYLLAQAVFAGMLGASAGFSPLLADITLWFRKRRGIAVALVASGNYLGGAFWPPLLQWATQDYGWRGAHALVAVICLAGMVPLALCLRRKPPVEAVAFPSSPTPAGRSAFQVEALPASPRMVQTLIMLAGIGCCVAMAMPQVHIVAYCADLGFGVAVGAQMLSLMLGLGIVSRIASGLVADRIGGLRTLLIGSTLQCLALMLFIPFNGLASLYVVSAVFGLAQGGIIPSYALVVRDFFPAKEAGSRIASVIAATIAGMALGGWLSGEIYDVTGSYQAAFINGIIWNLLNMAIMYWLLRAKRPDTPRSMPLPAAAG